MGDLKSNTQEAALSEYNEFIDNIMQHYDNSNEAERREISEDLLLFCRDRADKDYLRSARYS